MMPSGRTCTRGHVFQGEEPCPVCWPGYRTFTMRVKLWLYSAEKAAWHFVTVPKKESKILRERFADITRGWGSLKVRVTVGETAWKTSIFPDKKLGAYVLPIKEAVRKKESLATGDTLRLTLEVLT